MFVTFTVDCEEVVIRTTDASLFCAFVALFRAVNAAASLGAKSMRATWQANSFQLKESSVAIFALTRLRTDGAVFNASETKVV